MSIYKVIHSILLLKNVSYIDFYAPRNALMKTNNSVNPTLIKIPAECS